MLAWWHHQQSIRTRGKKWIEGWYRNQTYCTMIITYLIKLVMQNSNWSEILLKVAWTTINPTPPPHSFFLLNDLSSTSLHLLIISLICTLYIFHICMTLCNLNIYYSYVLVTKLFSHLLFLKVCFFFNYFRFFLEYIWSYMQTISTNHCEYKG